MGVWSGRPGRVPLQAGYRCHTWGRRVARVPGYPLGTTVSHRDMAVEASSFIVTQPQWAQAAGWCCFCSAVGPGQVRQAWCKDGVNDSAELTLIFCSSEVGRPLPLGAPSLRTTSPAAASCSPWPGSHLCSWTSPPLRHRGKKLPLLQAARVCLSRQ